MENLTVDQEIFKNELFNNFANFLLNNGFKIVVPSDPSQWNYLHFEKDNKIGYCQLSDFKCGICFSTVHKGNKNCGTGFGLHDSPFHGIESPTIEDVESAFIFAPNWAKRADRESVIKYKDLNEFLSNKINTSGTVINPNN